MWVTRVNSTTLEASTAGYSVPFWTLIYPGFTFNYAISIYSTPTSCTFWEGTLIALFPIIADEISVLDELDFPNN